MLHLSALPVWPMEGKGGMPSLRETLRGHVRGGHSIVLVLPRYHLFEDRPRRMSVQHDDACEVYFAPCVWAPALLAVRRAARRLGGGKEMPYALRWFLNLALCALLTGSLVLVSFRLRYRNKRRFDLVYAHNQYAAVAGWLLGRLFGIPNVTRLYGTFLADLMSKPLVTLRYPVAAAGFLVPHSLLICANDGTRGDEVARRLGIRMERFRFWQNGVDLPANLPARTRQEVSLRSPGDRLRLESKWIISCSRLTYWKRLDRVIRALHAAREAGCDCQLLMAGAGLEEEPLRALASRLGVEQQVAWLGAVEHGAVWELMQVADAFIITNDVTNRCNPLYEAICAQLPVVSVRDPATADLLDHGVNALLADKEDTDALGKNLYRVCTDPALAASMRRAQAERRKQLWSWRERMKAEVGELEQLVEGRRPSMARST